MHGDVQVPWRTAALAGCAELADPALPGHEPEYRGEDGGRDAVRADLVDGTPVWPSSRPPS
ncbi:hypothetical protein [Streptomyces sp. NPDC059371]|uniref:hypothetical protein n=1 Tax=Streptomyces sp. NPDC059371 TaxID=3346812 RepID=UPI0036C81AF9